MAMSDAERQKKRRERLRSEGKHTLLVRGANGEYDERIGIAFAVKKLAEHIDWTLRIKCFKNPI